MHKTRRSIAAPRNAYMEDVSVYEQTPPLPFCHLNIQRIRKLPVHDESGVFGEEEVTMKKH